jgi:selenocysteine-specific translation elongation factor
MDRQALIARKQEVRRQLEQARRELTHVEAQPTSWRSRRAISALQAKIERLMAEEHSLRLEIDRTRE